MNQIKAFLMDKKTTTFLWHCVNGFIGLLATYFSGENLAYAPIVIAGLNLVTKYVNKEFLS